jgi:hypothetical protein
MGGLCNRLLPLPIGLKTIVAATYWFEDGQGTGRNKCPFFILWKGLAEFGLYGSTSPG